MKVSELISLLQQQNPDADVQFDTITIDANSNDEAEALTDANFHTLRSRLEQAYEHYKEEAFWQRFVMLLYQ